ncbi:MAG: hypothetical protein QNI91_14085 [Arenicellales bacterium]|nr:hypothetical protein [Arenicellales bacterium]
MKILHKVEGLVTITWEEDLKAIRLSWENLYREDSGVRDAVEWAFDYVRQNGVKNWIADLSEVETHLSEGDKEWAMRRFNQTIVELGIDRFVTIKPCNMETISDWDESARETFAKNLDLFHVASLEEAAFALRA